MSIPAAVSPLDGGFRNLKVFHCGAVASVAAGLAIGAAVGGSLGQPAVDTGVEAAGAVGAAALAGKLGYDIYKEHKAARSANAAPETYNAETFRRG